ncbi:hypothetical protein MUK42_15184 [Musa troglodytarum]|uniref:Uncharacterized protein n=1 Tax=Musa troglodytarum TaxID=320322 RepID=A0A9E7I9W8_9LILI|nr:hypothetical protein MUK42_15184 [Musa troglodytarum]URE45372.1 hypothetical protein MUK42_15184 [Musa troglodytarum]URE45373.1 hypothetical protein MUK42_15184 [Musa troglodytarum]
MAYYRTPAAIQNENFRIRIGKDVDLAKAVLPKPAKAGRQDRKALKDLSNTGKPPVSGPSKASALKDKSALRARETIKTAPKRTILTDEEMKRCHEWAREGIEQTHFTGNDLQKLQKDIDEERVNKKVRKVMSDLHERSNDLGLTEKVLSKGTEDVKKMELETEVLPIITTSPTPGHEEIDSLLESEAHHHPSFLERPIEFQLKEDYYNADGALA